MHANPSPPPPDMNDVVRLTREGRLAEATALIQRLLRGEPAPAAPPRRAVRRTLRRPPPRPPARANRGSSTWSPSQRAARAPAQSLGTTPPRSGWPGLPRMPEALRGLLDKVRGGIAEGRTARPVPAPRPVRGRRRRRPVAVAGGRALHYPLLQQRGRQPRLQALRPEHLSRAAGAAGGDAARLHPVARRLRRRDAHERARGGSADSSSPIRGSRPPPTRRNAGTGSTPPTSGAAAASPR